MEIKRDIERQLDQIDQALFFMQGDESALAGYFKVLLAWNKRLSQLALQKEGRPLSDWSMDELKALNSGLYNELLPSSYVTSFANPVYAKSSFGEMGSGLSALYYKMKSLIDWVFQGELERVEASNELVLAAYELFEQDALSEEVMVELLKGDAIEHAQVAYVRQFSSGMNPEKNFFTHLIETADLSDLRYLYMFGAYVSAYELRTAEFLSCFDQERIDEMARHIVKAYIAGFTRDNKDMSKRQVVRVVGILGQERLTRAVLVALKSSGLKGHVSELMSTDYNKQVAYDHKFDIGLYMDDELLDVRFEALEAAANHAEGFMRNYSGILYIEKFGEVPFSPTTNDARVILSDVQNTMFQRLTSAYRQKVEQFVPETERSFCIIAYPTPEIGEQFEEIFEAICQVNTLDSDTYEGIQHTMIEALDRGRYVKVLGANGNETDITVMLRALNSPQKETNFVNCVADVNIPVGEVFTSPVLEGTHGILHVEDIYLNDFRFYNLKLRFEEGMVVDYSCTNFADEVANKRFIEENLLFPHKTLPLGEFAIGTNTLAYVVANKFNIQDKLPILIIEKMGPHFAIGDTCFSYAEDHPVFNPIDGKEIVARTNTVAELRHTDLSKAYTHVHTDITLPYDSLDCITIYSESGESVDLIRGGRFVLAGTEVLNKPFED